MRPQGDLLKDKRGSQATSDSDPGELTPRVSAAGLTHRSSLRAWLPFPGTRAPAAGGGRWLRGGHPGAAPLRGASCHSLVPDHKLGCSGTRRPLLVPPCLEPQPRAGEAE